MMEHVAWTIELDDYITDIQWSPLGDTLLAATASGVMALFDTFSGTELFSVQAHNAPITALAWSPVLQIAGSAAQDGTVKFWAFEAGSLIGKHLHTVTMSAGKAAWAEHIVWSPDGAYCAATCGKIVVLFDEMGKELERFDHTLGRSISSISWHPDRLQLAVGSYGGVAIYNPGEPESPKVYPLEAPIICTTWSPDATVLACGLQENAVHFWRVLQPENNASAIQGYPDKVRQVLFDSKSIHLVSISGAGMVVWDFLGGGPEGTKPLVLSGHETRISCAAYQHQGGVLVSGDENGVLMLFNPDIGERPLRAEGYNQEISSIRWSPDDTLLVVGTAQGYVDVWSPED